MVIIIQVKWSVDPNIWKDAALAKAQEPEVSNILTEVQKCLSLGSGTKSLGQLVWEIMGGVRILVPDRYINVSAGLIELEYDGRSK